MQRIQKIWPDYPVDEALASKFTFYDAWDAPIKISGLVPNPERAYYRLPHSLANTLNEDIRNRLMWHTSGGCVRFATDAKEICVAVALREPALMNHMTVCGQSGVELYMESEEGYQEIGARSPAVSPCSFEPWITKTFALPGQETSTYCLYLPLYNGVKLLLIGLPEHAALAAPRKRRIETPITFYGSSITQGGCATKPGANYVGILGRRLDANIRNLGLSGNARGEESIAHYIASLDMSAFVLDYDHNAPSAEHLQATHEPFFRIVRAAQPNLPIIMVSRPDFVTDRAQDHERREVVRQTYQNAKAAGDEHVWFVDGETLFGDTDRDLCTVDGTHPNTLGFLRMADAIEPVLREALCL